MSRERARYLLLGAWLAMTVVVTVVEGTPGRLPAIALGYSVLLRCARRCLVRDRVRGGDSSARTGTGRLPTQLSTSGISYDAAETRETAVAIAELQEELDRHRAAIDGLAEQLDALRPTPRSLGQYQRWCRLVRL